MSDDEKSLSPLVIDAAQTGLFWQSLGGNNDDRIGGNTHVYSYVDPQKPTEAPLRIMVELGLMFGSRRRHGVDELFPDMSDFFVNKHTPDIKPRQPVEALFLTHGHADHVGAVAHYLNLGYELPPIYAPQLTVRTLLNQLARQKIPSDVLARLQIHVLQDQIPVGVGPFVIMPFTVSHSFGFSMGFGISTPTANVFHSGDLKADTTTELGATDFGALARWARDNKVAALMMDSTAAPKPGFTTAESTVRDELVRLIKEQPKKRFIAAVMAQNHQRLDTLAAVAAATNRVMLVTGDAIQNSLRALRDAGIDFEQKYGCKIISDPAKVQLALVPPVQRRDEIKRLARRIEQLATQQQQLKNGGAALLLREKESENRKLNNVMGKIQRQINALSSGDDVLGEVEILTEQLQIKNAQRAELEIAIAELRRGDAALSIKRLGAELSKVRARHKRLSELEESGLRPEQTLVVASGTQGEPLANLYKYAHGQHDHLKRNPRQDVVLLSAIIIPGNDNAVSRLVNKLDLEKIPVITADKATIHSSGHGAQLDLKKYYDTLQPRSVVPMHGDVEQLTMHKRWIKDCGFVPLLLSSNAQIVTITAEGARLVAGPRPMERWIGARQVGSFASPVYEYVFNLDTQGRPLMGLPQQPFITPQPLRPVPPPISSAPANSNSGQDNSGQEAGDNAARLFGGRPAGLQHGPGNNIDNTRLPAPRRPITHIPIHRRPWRR